MKDSKITRHHIIPRSRKGLTEKGNIVMVSHYEHDKYHQLFRNLTPTEILHYLLTVFWGNNTDILVDYLNELEEKQGFTDN